MKFVFVIVFAVVICNVYSKSHPESENRKAKVKGHNKHHYPNMSKKGTKNQKNVQAQPNNIRVVEGPIDKPLKNHDIENLKRDDDDVIMTNAIPATKNLEMPEHIEINNFQVTTSVPYLTVGLIKAIGYQPIVPQNFSAECVKKLQEHLVDEYFNEPADYSDIDESSEDDKEQLKPSKLYALN